jgi:hypothetical protein
MFFHLQKPQVTKTPDSQKVANVVQSNWPTYAQLVLPPTRKDLRLTDQHVYVAGVVRDAISAVTKEILLENSFPETDSKLKYRRGVILQAAKAAAKKIPPVHNIYVRSRDDMAFCDALGRLVSDFAYSCFPCLLVLGNGSPFWDPESSDDCSYNRDSCL